MGLQARQASESPLDMRGPAREGSEECSAPLFSLGSAAEPEVHKHPVTLSPWAPFPLPLRSPRLVRTRVWTGRAPELLAGRPVPPTRCQRGAEWAYSCGSTLGHCPGHLWLVSFRWMGARAAELGIGYVTPWGLFLQCDLNHCLVGVF